MRSVVLAVICRALFVSHSLLAIVKAQGQWKEPIYWVLLTPVGLSLLEAVITIFARGGKEYKWISPCVLLYLCGVLPSIWLLEFWNLKIRNDNHVCNNPYWAKKLPGCSTVFTHEDLRNISNDEAALKVILLDKEKMKTNCEIEHPAWINATRDRIARLKQDALTTTSYDTTNSGGLGAENDLNDQFQSSIESGKAAIQNVLSILDNIFDPGTWILVFHQSLLFILIIGRWLLPTGKGVGRDELSQLLLVFIGVGADILEFVVEMIKEESVRCDRTLIIMIMTLWSWSTLQFTMVLTASKARRPRAVGIYDEELEMEEEDEEEEEPDDGSGTQVPYELEDTKECGKCMEFFTNVEVWGISSTLILQDGPFLAMRLYIMIARNVIHQMIIFFTIKNLLVFFLQVYRLVVIATTKPEDHHENKSADNAMKKARANLNTLRSVAVAQERFKRASLTRQRTRTSMISTSSSLGRRRDLPRGRIMKS